MDESLERYLSNVSVNTVREFFSVVTVTSQPVDYSDKIHTDIRNMLQRRVIDPWLIFLRAQIIYLFFPSPRIGMHIQHEFANSRLAQVSLRSSVSIRFDNSVSHS